MYARDHDCDHDRDHDRDHDHRGSRMSHVRVLARVRLRVHRARQMGGEGFCR
jgi:hypothetical protein